MNKNSIVLLNLGFKNYQELYLDWLNNFLTITGFADYYHINIDIAEELVNNAVYLYSNQKKD